MEVQMETKRGTVVFCNTSYEGIHNYLDAPNEVAYLRSPHRHIFHVKVELEVFHNDREIEFIMLKHIVDEYLDKNKSKPTGVFHMGTMSCEDIANQIIDYVDKTLARDRNLVRSIAVTVSEDNENGAYVYGVV